MACRGARRRGGERRVGGRPARTTGSTR
jgi:hypothetical protein